MTIRGPFAVALLVLLFISIAANMVVAGFTIARVNAPRPGGEIERIVALGVRAFPKEIRGEIEQRSRAQREALRGKLRLVEAARRDMLRAMRAQPFDQGALDAAFQRLRDTTADLQRAGQEIVTDVIAETPHSVRRKIRHRRGPFR